MRWCSTVLQLIILTLSAVHVEHPPFSPLVGMLELVLQQLRLLHEPQLLGGRLCAAAVLVRNLWMLYSSMNLTSSAFRKRIGMIAAVA